MGFKLGATDGKLYLNTGTYGSPTWDLIPNADDVNFPIESDEADTSNRAAGGFETIIPGLHKITVEFGMVYDPADTDYTTIRDAHLARTLKEWGVADGLIATNGTQYLRLHAYVVKSGVNQPLREAMKVPVTLRPGYSSNANPAWVTVSA